MKTFFKKYAFIIGVSILLATSAKAQEESISIDVFYDELSPYGSWITDREYGRVWRPNVDHREFRPYYSNGHWVMTSYGNTWVSNYTWGWAPFHYGRWFLNRYNEWVWIPGTQWGPAWVTWRSGGGYYGWAPMLPNRAVSRNIYGVPNEYWNFIPQQNIYYESYPRYYGHRNHQYIRNSVTINHIYIQNNNHYYSGPRLEDVRRAARGSVRVYEVNRNAGYNAPRFEQTTINFYTPRPNRGESNASVDAGRVPNHPSRSESYTEKNNTTPSYNPNRSQQVNTVEPVVQPQNNQRPTRSEQPQNSPQYTQPQRAERSANPSQTESRSQQQSRPNPAPQPQSGGRPSRGG